MKIALYTNSVSPHQLPLARRLASRLGEKNYCYVYTDDLSAERRKMGWLGRDLPSWCVPYSQGKAFLDEADFVYCENRDLVFLKRRSQAKKITAYVSERWFKPRLGMGRMLSPAFFSMARKMTMLLDLPWIRYFPQGIHAAEDMIRLKALLKGDVRSLLSGMPLEYEHFPLGRIAGGGISSQMRLWGYFVEPTTQLVAQTALRNVSLPPGYPLKVLWVGRMLKWKRADTVVRAVMRVNEMGTLCRLTLVGNGPEQERLRLLSSRTSLPKSCVSYIGFVPMENIRKIMREHQVLVLASDGGEGWGAVLNEALEEDMIVLGTHEAGSSRTILPSSRRFKAGDSEALAQLLLSVARGGLAVTGIGDWAVDKAADRLIQYVEEQCR